MRTRAPFYAGQTVVCFLLQSPPPPLPCQQLTRPSYHSDYINPIDLCNRLNTYIIPEAAVHGFLTFLFLINGYWLPLVLNVPLLAWNIKKYVLAIQPGPAGARKMCLECFFCVC